MSPKSKKNAQAASNTTSHKGNKSVSSAKAKKETKPQKTGMFKKVSKEVNDLFHLDISRLEDPKIRKKLLIRSIPYIVFGYVGDLISYSYRMSTAEGKMGRLMDTLGSLGEVISRPIPSFNWRDILFGIAVGVGFRLVVYFKGKNAKKYRKGREYGSAELGGEKDIEPFINREYPDNNLIFTQTEQMSIEGRMPSPLYNRNKNVLVIGGSGSGKTRYYAKPNLMQLNCSYVFTDPKGYLWVGQ